MRLDISWTEFSRVIEISQDGLSVTVYQKLNHVTDEPEEPGINWSALGTVDRNTTRTYIKLLEAAIEVSHEIAQIKEWSDESAPNFKGTCCLCSRPVGWEWTVGWEWKGLYRGPVHLSCANLSCATQASRE